MFGPEASGLSNDDISYSNYIFKIPVNKKFQSINLSHSIILVCYEIFKNCKPSYFNKEKKLNDIILSVNSNDPCHYLIRTTC